MELPQDKSIWFMIVYIGFEITKAIKRAVDKRKQKDKEEVVAEEVAKHVAVVKKQVEDDKHGNSVMANALVDGKIYPFLWTLHQRFNALRVYITQFHNGSKFYTGQSI